MLHSLARNLASCWRGLTLTDIVFKVVTFSLLTPLVSLLFHGFLRFADRTVLADTDIVLFLLDPVGWITVIVAGGALIAINALEKTAMMSISLAAMHGQSLSVVGVLRFTAGRAAGVYRIVVEAVGRLLLLSAPFLAAGGGLYALLLTDHDINFYLTEQPPRFQLAVGLIGAVLFVLALLVIRYLVAWSLALPLYLFENVPAAESLAASRQRVAGHGWTITGWLVGWFLANGLMSLLATRLIIDLGQLTMPTADRTLWKLMFTLGLLLTLWNVANFATTLLSSITLGSLLATLYDRLSPGVPSRIPGENEQTPGWTPKLTRERVVASLVISGLVAALIGATAIHSADIDDDVQITAHRGGAAHAPENTLAAIRRAIEDGADWVEIDVQESKDGVVVVVHDSDLKKLGGGDARIWEATADELRSVDIGRRFGPEFAGETVPTLAEVLETCRNRIGVNIELKYYGHDVNLERKVIRLVEQYDMADQVVIMSLKPKGIRKVQQLRPDWTVGLLTAVAAGDLTRAEVDFLAVSTGLASAAFITAAHRRGRQVHVWTVNDAMTMSTLMSRGVDNIITDDPALARQVLDFRDDLSPIERALLELSILLGVGTMGSSAEQ